MGAYEGWVLASNWIGILPAAIAFYYGFAVQGLYVVVLMLASTFYHACDEGMFCVFGLPLGTLEELDYFSVGSVLASTVLLLAAFRSPVAEGAWLALLQLIMSVWASYDRTNNLVPALFLGAGFVFVGIKWAAVDGSVPRFFNVGWVVGTFVFVLLAAGSWELQDQGLFADANEFWHGFWQLFGLLAVAAAMLSVLPARLDSYKVLHIRTDRKALFHAPPRRLPHIVHAHDDASAASDALVSMHWPLMRRRTAKDMAVSAHRK